MTGQNPAHLTGHRPVNTPDRSPTGQITDNPTRAFPLGAYLGALTKANAIFGSARPHKRGAPRFLGADFCILAGKLTIGGPLNHLIDDSSASLRFLKFNHVALSGVTTTVPNDLSEPNSRRLKNAFFDVLTQKSVITETDITFRDNLREKS